MKYLDENIIALIDMLEYDIWAIIRDPHIDCVCKNFNTKQGEPSCIYCLGTGNKIKIKKIKGVRQPTSGSARDMTINYERGIYFVKNIYELKPKDILIWGDFIEEIDMVQSYCSDAQKPVYYKIETIPKKTDTEILLKNFCKLTNTTYRRRR